MNTDKVINKVIKFIAVRAILILVIALILIFTSGCDFGYGKDKIEKPSKQEDPYRW